MMTPWRRAPDLGQDRDAPGHLADGRRIYAVGDPHGCRDRLEALHALIADDLEERPVAAPLLVHLGDYIDRGPDSAGIIDLLSRGDPLGDVPTVNLLGNHEAMMLDALPADDEGAIGHWLDNGGRNSLDSWGIPPSAGPQQWEGLIPASHLRFLRGLGRQHLVDGYAFVHAGFWPGNPLAAQTDHDRVWMREPFLSAAPPVLPDRPDLAVVHGHTPARAPEVTPTRIGVDTGAVRGGKLTCAVLEGRRVRFLQS